MTASSFSFFLHVVINVHNRNDVEKRYVRNRGECANAVLWLQPGGKEFGRLTFMMFINQGCNSERKQKSNLQVTDRKVMEIPHNHISNADYDIK